MRDPADNRTIDFLEDAEANGRSVVDPDRVLTDEDLQAGGLTKITAHVRTRAGKSALRAKRHKEKEAQRGVKQVNVMAPESVQPVIREIALRTKNGESLEDVIRDITPTPAPALPPAPVLREEEQAILDCVRHGGWRARLIRFLSR